MVLSIVFRFLAILAILQYTSTVPLKRKTKILQEIEDIGSLAAEKKQFPWQVSGHFQGDIMLEESGVTPRNGLVSAAARWPDRTVPYYIDPVFTASERAVIESGLNEFHRRTCIRFRPYRSGDRDYVYVSGDNTGCWSYVGRLNNGQLLNLQRNGCVHHGIVVHEFLHALGFYHQQSATERDDYVRVLWQNIQPGYEYAFDKYGTNVISNFNTAYDYRSIMHYDAYAFSVNGQPTLQSIRGSQTLGQIQEMTETDIVKLERMYGCRA